MKLIAGSSLPQLAEQIADITNQPLTRCTIGHFADGELRVEIQEDLQQEDVFIIQSLAKQPNEYLIETLLLANAAKRAGAKKIHGVIPYLAYMRQDTNLNHQAYSAQVVGQILSSHFDSIITVDPHSPQIPGFFSIPVVDISTSHMIAADLRERQLGECVIVSPDLGGAKRAEAAMPSQQSKLAIVEKKRSDDGIELVQLLGDVAGKDCVIIDDVIGTGETIIQVSQLLKQHQAQSIRAYITHPIFAQKSLKDIQQSPIDELVVFDTIHHQSQINDQQLSVAEEIASAIIQQSGG